MAFNSTCLLLTPVSLVLLPLPPGTDFLFLQDSAWNIHIQISPTKPTSPSFPTSASPGNPLWASALEFSHPFPFWLHFGFPRLFLSCTVHLLNRSSYPFNCSAMKLQLFPTTTVRDWPQTGARPWACPHHVPSTKTWGLGQGQCWRWWHACLCTLWQTCDKKAEVGTHQKQSHYTVYYSSHLNSHMLTTCAASQWDLND